jgi:hypothetical protein
VTQFLTHPQTPTPTLSPNRHSTYLIQPMGGVSASPLGPGPSAVVTSAVEAAAATNAAAALKGELNDGMSQTSSGPGQCDWCAALRNQSKTNEDLHDHWLAGGLGGWIVWERAGGRAGAGSQGYPSTYVLEYPVRVLEYLIMESVNLVWRAKKFP